MSYSTVSASLLSVFHGHALHTPSNEFLVEDNDVSLSYDQAYVLATLLIPARLRTLFPSLATSSTHKAILLSHNNSLFILSCLAFWRMSVTVVPISTSAEPSLWGGMVKLIDPDFILVAPNLIEPLCRSLDKAALDKTYTGITDIRSLIPSEFLFQSDTPIRASDFIPSCSRWLKHVYPSPRDLRHFIMESSLPALKPDGRALTLFTSSAVDWATLKCVSYSHEIGIVLGTGGAYIFFDSSLSSPSSLPSTQLSSLLLAGLAYHRSVTTFTTVPAILTSIIEECTHVDLGRLRALESLGVGGARTPESLFQWAATQGIPYFDCSGATELAGTICVRRALDPSQRQNGLQVIPGLMGMLEKASPSEKFGELIIRGTYLPIGYDARKSDAFQFDPVTGITTYRTGDLYSHQARLPVLSYLSGEKMPPYDPDRQPLCGLSYMGRTDDLLVFASGIKADALSLERVLDAHANIAHSALVINTTGDALVALIQPYNMHLTPTERLAIIDVALSLNKSLSFEQRLRPENVYIVQELPVTTKFTLNRKKVKKLFSEMHRDSDIPIFFPPPSGEVPVWDTTKNENTPSVPLQLQVSPANADHRRRLYELLARTFGVEKDYFDSPDASLVDFPLTSLLSVQLTKALFDDFGVSLTSSQLYGIHSIDNLSSILEIGSKSIGSNDMAPSASSTCQSEKIPAIPLFSEEDIVISGAACRFVGGVDSLDSFWSALLSPDIFIKHLSRQRPSSRWKESHNCQDMVFPSGWLSESALDNISSFAEFFDISPLEAREMSPNARLVLQLGYQAIEDAGIAPRTLNGKNWGVFTSVNDSGWRERRVSALGLREYASGIHGSADEAAGARLSYFLNLTGPALETKTACSSSAVAIHQACSAIRNGDCEAAVVIAATTHFYPAGAIFRSQMGIVSSSGKCAPFSDSADGFVASEGGAAIVLQKHVSAKEMAYGIIRATSVTQDGASRGFFAPNPQAQRRLLETALKKANLSADDISFIEAHGTGTQLGDAIELQAVHETFGANRSRPLYLGSVKAVVGHTEECAGLAGVIKTLLCFSNNAIPPQPRTGPLNKSIDFASCSMVIPFRITAFLPQTQPRLCGVSAFGLFGTLAHVIIQEPQPEPELPHPTHSSSHIFLLSARNAADYRNHIVRYLDFFTGRHLRENALESVCRTTQLGRDHFPIRAAWNVVGWSTLLDAFHEALSLPPPLPLRQYSTRVGIWFGLPLSGGTLGVNKHPLYESKLSACLQAGWASQYEYFAQELALAQCLATLGCDICVVGGEGMTEYVAATFAGSIPPRAVFRFIRQTNPMSRQVTVQCSKTVLDEFLTMWRADELRKVGQHGPNLFTLCGTLEALSALASEADIMVDLENPLPPPTILAPIDLRQPSRIPIVSSHLGDIIDDETVLNLDYWSHVQDRDMHTTSSAVWEAMRSQCDIVVILGGAADVSNVFDKCIAGHQNSLEILVGHLFEVGCVIDWSQFASCGPRAHLPPYTWATETECDDLRATTEE